MKDVTKSDKIKVLILLLVYSSARKILSQRPFTHFWWRIRVFGCSVTTVIGAMTQQQPKPEEVLGMIQGLASAMQTSFDAQKATTKQVTEIADSLKDLAEAQSKPSVPQARVDRLRGDTCPYVCPQTGLN